MTTYDIKYQSAIDELISAGKSSMAANPPIMRLMRKMGLKPRPVYYLGFWKTFFLFGIMFSFIWGCFMYFFFWQNTSTQLGVYFIASLFAGMLFGLLMSAYCQREKKRCKLSDWDSL
jgi:hypothetical protein